jgi:hypothetical protein
MARPKSAPTRPLQFKLTEEWRGRMEKLKEETGSTNFLETFKQAVIALEEKVKRGKK